MRTGRLRLDWTAARAIPILIAARRLHAAIVDKRQQRCPFKDHPDSTPSFSLDTAKNLFHCFGCGRSGSVIQFVAAFRDTDDREACRWLLGLPEAGTASPGSTVHNRAPMPPAKTADAEVYAAFLALAPIGAEGLAYLAARCITPATAVHFQIGQIGEPAETLQRLVMQYGTARVAAAGLTLQSGRLCFPKDALLFPYFSGGALQFLQSRRTDTGNPRWMGLSGIGKIPFNVDASTTAADIYLVEGAIDVLSAYELGHTAIGLPGPSAALPRELCAALRRKTVYLIPDKDDSGARIAARTREALSACGVQVTIQTLSAGKDLNDYLTIQRGRNA